MLITLTFKNMPDRNLLQQDMVNSTKSSVQSCMDLTTVTQNVKKSVVMLWCIMNLLVGDPMMKIASSTPYQVNSVQVICKLIQLDKNLHTWEKETTYVTLWADLSLIIGVNLTVFLMNKINVPESILMLNQSVDVEQNSHKVATLRTPLYQIVGAKHTVTSALMENLA